MRHISDLKATSIFVSIAAIVCSFAWSSTANMGINTLVKHLSGGKDDTLQEFLARLGYSIIVTVVVVISAKHVYNGLKKLEAQPRRKKGSKRKSEA